MPADTPPFEKQRDGFVLWAGAGRIARSRSGTDGLGHEPVELFVNGQSTQEPCELTAVFAELFSRRNPPQQALLEAPSSATPSCKANMWSRRIRFNASGGVATSSPRPYIAISSGDQPC